MPTTQPSKDEARINQEIDVLQQFALRWAVLAAWQDELSHRKVTVPQEVAGALEVARTKIASGCFSSCEVGTHLSTIEGSLVSTDASSPVSSVDFWVELLGHAMSDKGDTERLLSVPSVKFRYSGCGLDMCKCE